MDNFTTTQLKAVAIFPKISALVSLSFATYTAVGIIQSKAKRSRVYHRFMLVIALYGIPLSAAFLLGTWPVPKGTPDTVWSAGTIETCTVQGFFINYFGVSVSTNYASLSLYSVIAVQNNFDQKVLRKFEPWLHAVVTIYPLFSSIYTASNQMFNPAGPWCWIEMHPMGCLTDDTIECTRGISNDDLKSVNKFKWTVFAGVPLSFIFSVVMITVLFVLVRSAERDTKEAGGKNKRLTQARHKKSSIVAHQSSIYLIVGYSSIITTMVVRFVQMSSDTMWFPLALLGWTLNPLQTFLVLLVYKMLHEKSIGPQLTNNNPMSVAAISKRAQQSKLRRELETNKITETRYEMFSIFDGSSPSAQWAEFIVDDSDEENND